MTMDEYVCTYYDNEEEVPLTEDEKRAEFYDEWFRYIAEFDE